MSAIIRDAFKVKSLQQFIATLSTNSLYLGIGRPYFWDTSAGSDSTTPVPYNTVKSVSNDWEDVYALKRIAITDAITGFFKELWEPNVKYDAYHHDWDGTRASVYNGKNVSVAMPNSIADVKCVVITPSYNIYMCLKQPVVNGEVQASVYDPDSGVAVGTNTTVVKTADGYFWKFIGVTSAADILKFSNKYYHPVETIAVEPAPADPYYNQWLAQVRSAQFKGGIYTINVKTKGSGYTYNGTDAIAGSRDIGHGTSAFTAEDDPEFKVIGDGIGLAYTVTYGALGTIDDITIVNPGYGYTHAVITARGGLGATFDVVFTPKSGLGVSPVKDLVARYMILNTQLVGADGSGDFTVANDYRKLNLIYNPMVDSTNIATASTIDASIRLTLTGTGMIQTSYPTDAIVQGVTSGARARVIDWNPTTKVLRLLRTSSENAGYVGANNDFVMTEVIQVVVGDSAGSFGTVSVISAPEVLRHTGDILYSEYRGPINRQLGQTESLTIILKF